MIEELCGSRRRRPQNVPRDRGSGVVLVVGAIGALLSLMLGGLMVLSAVLASHRAQAAADLGALAAASSLVAGEGSAAACADGARVVAANAAVLLRCRDSGGLSVELVVEVPASISRIGTATARARAGPSSG